jgi:hypothetical protein
LGGVLCLASVFTDSFPIMFGERTFVVLNDDPSKTGHRPTAGVSGKSPELSLRLPYALSFYGSLGAG